MILADAGPLVALFNPADNEHRSCVERLQRFREPLLTTVPVLTEAFCFLDSGSRGALDRKDFTTYGTRRGHRELAFELV